MHIHIYSCNIPLGMLCTQCEAMGFRRITYSFDRPDVLSKYKVRLEGITKRSKNSDIHAYMKSYESYTYATNNT